LAETLDRLDRASLDLANMAREKAAALDKAVSAAQKLHQARQTAGRRLAALQARNLKPLGFPEMEIEVAVESPPKADDQDEVEKQISANGFDRVDFLFSPNPGEGKNSLTKIASGGELSRILLALKTLEDRPSDQLVVFDEIDAGLGGAAAGAVAGSLATLAGRQQLIVITHLPQVAALSGRHFMVTKEADPATGRTLTSMTRLSQVERARELARMLGGTSPSPEAVALADKMLASAPGASADKG
jgi:DNA repair protein RecN (Recombination protein N)